MTAQERKQAFDKLFDSLPGKNIDRVRAIANALFCKPNTVRIYRMKATNRVIPEAKLKMLQRHFAQK